MFNWIIWNGTVFDIETVPTLNGIVWYRTLLTFNCVTKINILLNWIGWIRTVWINWIAWNRNDFDDSTLYSC